MSDYILASKNALLKKADLGVKEGVRYNRSLQHADATLR